LVLDGDQGFANAAQILNQMRGHEFSDRSLDLVVSQLVYHGKLHWKAEKATANGEFYRDGRRNYAHKSATELPKANDGEFYEDGRRNHSYKSAAAELPKQVKEAHWRVKAQEVQGNTHAHTQAIRRMFVNDADGSVDWHATFTARDRAASGTRGSI
jgi:hypothetical protein